MAYQVEALTHLTGIAGYSDEGGKLMKISTKGKYGLEALLDLAIHSAEGHVSLKNIAERCNISEAYILQIFLVLRRAGIVESVRGAQGGYFLAKDSADISVGEILSALEGPLAPVVCIVEGKSDTCDRYDLCAARTFWATIMTELTDLANSISLVDLLKSYRSMDTSYNDNIDYYI